MKKLGLLLLLVGLASTSFSQIKKVKIKAERGVKYLYHTDSVCFERKDVIAMTRVFHDFYIAVRDDNFEGFKDCLSPNTLKIIQGDKLERKFGKYKKYQLKFTGNVDLRYIKPIPVEKTPEPTKVYILAIKLSDNQVIKGRVGFDPLKRLKFDGDEHYLGMTMVKTDAGFRVSILW